MPVETTRLMANPVRPAPNQAEKPHGPRGRGRQLALGARISMMANSEPLLCVQAGYTTAPDPSPTSRLSASRQEESIYAVSSVSSPEASSRRRKWRVAGPARRQARGRNESWQRGKSGAVCLHARGRDDRPHGVRATALGSHSRRLPGVAPTWGSSYPSCVLHYLSPRNHTAKTAHTTTGTNLSGLRLGGSMEHRGRCLLVLCAVLACAPTVHAQSTALAGQPPAEVTEPAPRQAATSAMIMRQQQSRCGPICPSIS